MSEELGYSAPPAPLNNDELKQNTIGGTYICSTKIDPEKALAGVYQPINGDSVPSGANVEGKPTNQPYLPKN